MADVKSPHPTGERSIDGLARSQRAGGGVFAQWYARGASVEDLAQRRAQER